MTDLYKAPAAPLESNDSSREGGSVEKGLAGDYDLQPIEILKEAWGKIGGLMWPLLGGVALVWVISMLFGGVEAFMVGDDPFSKPLLSVVLQLVSMLIAAPLSAGLYMMAIKYIAGSKAEFSEVFAYFDKTIPLFLMTVLMSVLIIVGFALLILPGIYLVVSYWLAMPLLVEKNMGVWEAMETSRKAIHHKWFTMAGFGLLSGVVLVLGALALLVGLIWAIPLVTLGTAIVYRNMFGIESNTLSSN